MLLNERLPELIELVTGVVGRAVVDDFGPLGMALDRLAGRFPDWPKEYHPEYVEGRFASRSNSSRALSPIVTAADIFGALPEFVSALAEASPQPEFPRLDALISNYKSLLQLQSDAPTLASA
jgi:hypothetical protein